MSIIQQDIRFFKYFTKEKWVEALTSTHRMIIIYQEEIPKIIVTIRSTNRPNATHITG